MSANNGSPSNADLMRAIQSMANEIAKEIEDLKKDVIQLRLDTNAKIDEIRADISRDRSQWHKSWVAMERRVDKLEEQAKETQEEEN